MFFYRHNIQRLKLPLFPTIFIGSFSYRKVENVGNVQYSTNIHERNSEIYVLLPAKSIST